MHRYVTEKWPMRRYACGGGVREYAVVFEILYQWLLMLSGIDNMAIITRNTSNIYITRIA